MAAEPPSVDLTVIAPMFNEAANVERTVGLVRDGLAGFDGTWEFVMVDDGSVDDTRGVARRAAADDDRLRVVGYDENQGRGKALRTGFDAARGEVVVSVDFDLSYSVEHVLLIHEALRDHPDWDVVLGSAYMPGGATEGVDPFRLLVSRTGNRVLSTALGGRVHTITCVLRGYRRHVLRTLDLESSGKEIHLEILAKALAQGYQVREIPATLRARKKGKSKFRLGGTAWNHLLFAFAERPMLVFGGIGILSALVGLVAGIVGLVLSFQGEPTGEGPLWSIVVLLFLGGIQFLSFGFLALLVGGLRREVFRLGRRVLELGGTPDGDDDLA